VARLVTALPAGSHVVLSHVTDDFFTPERLADLADLADLAAARPGRSRVRRGRAGSLTTPASLFRQVHERIAWMVTS
jgi:hypothetical protein